MAAAPSSPNDFLLISNVADEPLAIEMGHCLGQAVDIADVISLHVYANTEFCPRYLTDEAGPQTIGASLTGKTVVIVSAATNHTRGSLAMRTMILARAAKDNGAAKVVLVEPDLYFSAQDRGPQRGPDNPDRPESDLRKFDGQAFTAKLYAELLKAAGVDCVVTVHNHSAHVEREFRRIVGEFYNLIPDEVYAQYIRRSDMLETGGDGERLVLCAPDAGALPFVEKVRDSLGLAKAEQIVMDKVRTGERAVEMTPRGGAEVLARIEGKDVIVLDDMVRTGGTIVKCCNVLRSGGPRRICFGVTHFYASLEGRQNLNAPVLDEILTLNTIPSILNRDAQGRLRKKMVVLKIEKWIARFLHDYLGRPGTFEGELYTPDMSSKNPRWRAMTPG